MAQTGKYKAILTSVFDILDLPEAERAKIIDAFKRKLSYDFLIAIQNELPVGDKEWIKKNLTTASPTDPKIAEISKIIKKLYPEEIIHKKTDAIFKTSLEEYINSTSKNLDQERIDKLESILKNF